ncbi:MAG: tetratricopeptide repeat protein [Geobacteraceae bacterium]|nr:tetratricopeptide repeat protein [Geobacteraceae bacterium]
MPECIKKLLHELSPHRVQILILLIIVFALYGRILGHRFIYSWDDFNYVTNNFDIQGFSWGHIRAVFSSYYLGNYAPVQMLSYMADFALWGLNPTGFLLTNLLLHLFTGLLVYRLFLRLFTKNYPALWGSAIFLLHPVQVESVAWISQRKSLLSMVFFLASWECYRYYRDKGYNRGLWYFASLTLFVLAGLSKSVVVILPLVFILYDFCFPPTTARKHWLDKIPYFALSILLVLITMSSQQPDTATWGSPSAGGITAYHGGSPWATFLTMLPVICRYLWMIIWPVNLSVLYDPPVYTSVSLPVILSFMILLLLGVLSWRLLTRDRRSGFWVLFSVVAFIPVSQLIPIVTLMNDRYLYFPMIGIAGIFGLAVASINEKYGSRVVWVPTLVIIIFSILSYVRAGVWSDDITLWQDAVKKAPGKAEVWQNLGLSLQASPDNRKAEAIAAFEKSMEVVPMDSTLYLLGKAEQQRGNYSKALSHFEMLIALRPDNVMGLTALGDMYRLLGERDAALSCLLQAQSLQPEALQVSIVLGKLYADRGDLQQARNSFLRVEKEVQDGEIAFELACLEARQGNSGNALSWLEVAFQRGYRDVKEIHSRKELSRLKDEPLFVTLQTRFFTDKGPK